MVCLSVKRRRTAGTWYGHLFPSKRQTLQRWSALTWDKNCKARLDPAIRPHCDGFAVSKRRYKYCSHSM